jgi:hypothetical protein
MENPGERLVGDYLRFIKQCDFVDFNVYTLVSQGEIDVIGVNHGRKEAYVCEVATHLKTGIQYVGKDSRPDTAERLIRKFLKDIIYGTAAFPDHTVHYMLWSPVVRWSTGMAEYDQFAHIRRIEESVLAQTGVAIELVINQAFVAAIDALRQVARTESKELKSPVMRFLQIEEWSRKNADRDAKNPVGAIAVVAD